MKSLDHSIIENELCKKEHGNEQGFVLVTVIVLLAILSIIGAVSLFKSNIELKVSSGSVASAQAIAAAEAGLAHNFSYWKWDDRAGEAASGTTEQAAVVAAASAGAATSGIYNETFNGTAIPTDALIKAASTVRVYNITSTGMALVATNTWATTNIPQVAVWATRFNKQSAPAYPYNSSPTAGAGCSDCNIVVYALGRAGVPGRNDSRKMLREIQLTGTAQLTGVSAMTNAPAYANWQDACDGAYNAVPAGGLDKKGNTPTPATSPKESTIDWTIEVTQAEYSLGVSPSGIAYASNTNTGPGGKSFRKGSSTTTVATMDSDPLLVYSGHGTTSAMKADVMSTTSDTTSPNAPDLPAGKLPRRLVDQPLIGTSNVLDFFDPADPNKQLFNLDAYRWSAEQFTCQNQGTVGAAAAANTADGKFCAKSEALRLALVAQGYSAKAPVTGRMTLAEFMYNISKSIPMFGMVRVMYPIYYQGSAGVCSNYKGGSEVLLYDTASPTQGIYPGSYTGSPTTYSSNGEVGAGDAKLIVYGSILYDFFTDVDGNGFFDPSISASLGGVTVYEHLADAFEAVDARMELEIADFVNPALPNIPSASLVAFPTAAVGGTIAVGTSANDVNLASPTAGYFPASEGMIPVNTTIDYGQMQLMDLTGGVSKLNSLAAAIKSAGGLTGTAASDAGSYFGSVKTRLEYYYDLMKATAKQSDPNSWPMDDFPSTMSDAFCIGSDDCGTSNPATMTNNDGDKVHLLFPSAYMHSWKVALAALDLSASDWNSVLDGIDTLAAKFTGTYGENYASGARPRGSPFNKSIDPGFIRTAELIADQSKYFKTDAGAGGYALLTSNWMDIPAQMYAGGLVDIHEISNVSGVTYTPGPLEWETGHSGLSTPTSYFNGPIITGFGQYNDNSGISYTVLVYDNQSVDNINTNTTTIVMQRYAKEGL